jgi:hypothetical protein
MNPNFEQPMKKLNYMNEYCHHYFFLVHDCVTITIYMYIFSFLIFLGWVMR